MKLTIKIVKKIKKMRATLLQNNGKTIFKEARITTGIVW
jgi:hypothetical protein